MEQEVLETSPSHLEGAGRYALWTVCTWPLAIVIWPAPLVGLLGVLWTYLSIRGTRYRITSERVILTSGVLNKTTEELELFRVRDLRCHRRLIQRLFGVGDVILYSSDTSHPTTCLASVPDAEQLREQLRSLTMACRDEKHVKDIEVS